jgi:peptide chain release factor subunit 1
MKLLSREQIEDLVKFKNEDYFTTSFFLDTSKNRLTRKEIQLSLKNLLNSSKVKLDQMSMSKAKKDSLLRDLDKIKKYCDRNLPSYSDVGLALFSCSQLDYWQEFNLVKSPRNLIIFDQNPYVRPLSAILNEYNRVCVLTLDRKTAKWYEIYMGEITLLDTLTGDVPSKVREGGWEGYNSKRIERHIESLLHDFFKKSANKTFSLMKKHDFNWLLLGCGEEYYQYLEPLLHPYLKKKIKAHLKVKPSDSQDKILKAVLEVKDQLKKQEKQGLVKSFLAEIEKDGLAVSGLTNTLRALNRGEVQTLLVTRQFSKSGKKCPKCGFLFSEDSVCPSCQKKTDPMLDIIDEAVEAALNSSCDIRHINPPSDLDRYGKIGAFLRYKA